MSRGGAGPPTCFVKIVISVLKGYSSVPVPFPKPSDATVRFLMVQSGKGENAISC